jgi:hypothetical protein
MLEISFLNQKIKTGLEKVNKNLSELQRKYVRDLLSMTTNEKLFPDANLTLRVAYGKVEGTDVRDGMRYKYFTTVNGILDKSETGIDDYKINSRLAEIINNKDYGRYAGNGILNVAFLSSAHTTGGNSGSPTLNAKGELVGINYDRVWESVLSDYYYDEKYCRNINLDIRYALFIIEKFGNAKRLIDEMRIVD